MKTPLLFRPFSPVLFFCALSLGSWSALAADGENIALGKSATASSIEDGTLTADKAVDGNDRSRWSSEFVDHSWITIDLEERYTLSQVTLHWQNSYSKDYDIKVSDDGENWHTIESVTDSDGGEEVLAVEGTGRYLRVEGYKRATRWGHSLWELQVEGEVYVPEPEPPAPEENIALGKTVFASSIETAELTPEKAVDGNDRTRWSSEFTDHNWLTVDLGDRYNLSEIRLQWQNSYSKDYDIKVSDDGNQWRVLETVTDSDGGLDELALNGTGRYVRIEGYRRATRWGHSLWEVEIFGEPVPEPPPEVTNVARQAEAWASSVEEPSLPAGDAIDGNDRTRWSSDFTDHNWIALDLGQAHQLETVKLHWQNSYSKDYEIQVSQDAETWQTLRRVEDSDGGLEEWAVSARARYLRIEGFRRATRWGHSLWELEVYGYAADGGEDPGTGDDSDSDEDDSGNGDDGQDENPSDTQAPEAPGDLAVAVIDAAAVELAWSAASDDTGVTSYAIYRNDELLTELVAPATSLVDDTVAAGRSYQYQLVASDAAGNDSELSEIVSVSLPEQEEVLEGQVRLEWHTPDQRENGDYLELAEIGGYEIRYRRDGDDWTALVLDGAHATEHQLDLARGSYQFVIAVYDAEGLYSDFVPIAPVQ